MEITAVTVTYGNRGNLVEKCLVAVLSNGACRAVVVNNGGKSPITENMKEKYGKRIICVERNTNGGSAAGYYDGITSAISSGAEYIMLLDDDNCVKEQTIMKLKQTFTKLCSQESLDGICVLGNRYVQNGMEVLAKNSKSRRKRGDAFLEFHLSDKFDKAYRMLTSRIKSQKEEGKKQKVKLIPRSSAPYGGLMFHKSLIDRFGLPDRRFVLYQDDLEFTSRVVSGGGKIWMDTEAQIEDIEMSWHVSDKRLTKIETWLCSGSDLRVYYTARNMAYLETYGHRPSGMRKLNKAVYISLLFCLAVIMKKLKRFRLILSAVQRGEKGILGFDSKYPLA
ncbi:MAG: glycosyltransferase [Terracidiphilus sp.]|nr:glycosyltransferase [Terracidiphilus sp.]